MRVGGTLDMLQDGRPAVIKGLAERVCSALPFLPLP